MQSIARSSDAPMPITAQGRKRFDSKFALTAAAFLLPSVLLYSVFVFLPLFQAGYYGLYDWNGLGPLEDFVGLQNFRNVLNDDVFRQAIGHNLIILFLSLLIQLPLALALALVVGRRLRGRTAFRTIFFLPYVLSEVVTGVMWSFLFHPRTGLNELFGKIIPGYEPIGWLSDPNIVLYSVFIAITWKFVGFHFILYLAGLQNIPEDLHESAKLDGASNLRAIRDVTLPLLGPTIRLTVFLSAIGSLQFFDLIWVMTEGGPIDASQTMATYMYKFSFQRFALGYGAAASLVIFAICFGFALIYMRFVMNRDYSGARA
jgi:raffinose/stachyose/melibiose transport system permease protein